MPITTPTPCQRAMPDLMGMKNILALNDEAHHCYREKPKEADDEDLKGDERKEAEKNNEAARLWISGLEAVNRKLGLARVVDLSATPFFLRGSGYAEGTLFPWVMSDFSLMDAIECGIVKLPRVPVADNIPGNEMPMFRNLWEHIRKDMPKKGRGKATALDPLKLPTRLQTALEALYGHYNKTFKLWQDAGISSPSEPARNKPTSLSRFSMIWCRLPRVLCRFCATAFQGTESTLSEREDAVLPAERQSGRGSGRGEEVRLAHLRCHRTAAAHVEKRPNDKLGRRAIG